jgi:hypothetical protein
MDEIKKDVAQVTPDATEVKKEEVSTEEKLYSKEEVKTEEKPKEEVKKEEKVEVKKEEIKYDIKQAEGSLLSKERIDEIAAEAKKLGLSNEVAQRMADRENDAIKQYADNAKKELDQLVEVEWPKQVKEDKEIGGDNFKESIESAKRAFKQFGSEEFNKIINESGYGNHPELIRTFARIGKAMSNDKVIIGSTSPATQKSTAEILYGEPKKT